MEPGVANREGKGAIKRRRMRKVILQNSGNPPDADHKVVVVVAVAHARLLELEHVDLKVGDRTKT